MCISHDNKGKVLQVNLCYDDVLRKGFEWNNAVGDMLDNFDMLEWDSLDRCNGMHWQCGMLLYGGSWGIVRYVKVFNNGV